MNFNRKTCLKPFTWLEVAADKAYLCCPGWLNKDIGEYGDDNNIFALWNSDKSHKIRESIFDGSFKYCNPTICPRIQTGDLDDIKMILDGHFGEDLQKIFAEKKVHVDAPTYINLAYDRSCNLQCPSCRNEFIFLKENDHELKIKEEAFNKQLLDFIHNNQKIIRLYITGSGDPFASKLFQDFIKKIDLTKNPNIEVVLITNGVLFDQNHWEQISNIHNCNYIVSDRKPRFLSSAPPCSSH